MKKLMLFSTLASGLLLMASAAFAQPATTTRTTTTTTVTDRDYTPSFYVNGNINYALDYEDGETGDDGSGGMYFSGKLGYDFHPNMAAEFETGWQFNELEIDDMEAGTVHRVPILANLVLKAPIEVDRGGVRVRPAGARADDDRFEQTLVPYVSGGFGVMLYGVNDEDGVESDIDNGSLAFKTAVGVDYWFQRNMALNFETGYFFIPDPEVRVSGVSGARDIGADTWYIGAGIKARF